MKPNHKLRRLVLSLIVAIISLTFTALQWPEQQTEIANPQPQQDADMTSTAVTALAQLPTKGRSPKTGYARTQFSDGWAVVGGCDVRNIILRRDLVQPVVDQTCKVERGTLDDAYTAKVVQFQRGPSTSSDIQIDHVVALSNAWQTGAQLLSPEQRLSFANDPLNLIAVDGSANQAKSDGDAATWLPPNKSFRCQYVARQIAVKQLYHLWVTSSEREAMNKVLTSCPSQHLPVM